MGLIYFNSASNNNSNGGAILYRMKPLVLTSQLYGTGTTNTSSIPVWRSGAGDKSFEASVSTGITLYTTASTGVRTTTAAITYTTYLTSSNGVAFHLNSTDTCLYVLLLAGSSLQLIKINDTTGVVTSIGSSFTPTTVANWAGGTLSVDSGSGHLKYVSNGFYHLINKTTGAIVSQNTALSIGSYLARNVFYLTQDNTTGISPDIGTNTLLTGSYYFPNLVSSSYGHISSFALPLATAGALAASNGQTLLPQSVVHMADTDKVCITNSFTNNVSSLGTKYYLLSEFDKYLKSIADVGAGVI